MVLDLSGKILFHSDQVQQGKVSIDPQIVEAAGAKQETALITSQQKDKHYVAIIPILNPQGEPIGAVLRVPSDAESRANLHVGGRAARAPLDDADHRIISRVGPFLKEHGLFFVGIDVIGGLLTEINVTSPTGVQEINALEDTNLESVFMDRVEALVAAR